jgi:hypothetical protein
MDKRSCLGSFQNLRTKKSRKAHALEIRLQADNLERIGGQYLQAPGFRKKGLRLTWTAMGMRKVAARCLRSDSKEAPQ